MKTTQKRKKREYETVEFIGLVSRLIRRAGQRCADADEWELAELLGLQVDLERAVQTAVDGIRARGMSWAYIASATGFTRQAAFQKWGKPGKAKADELDESLPPTLPGL